MTRREFFLTAARWTAALTVGTATVSMARRKCTNQGVCRSCGVSKSCVLPQAMSYRLAKEEGRVG